MRLLSLVWALLGCAACLDHGDSAGGGHSDGDGAAAGGGGGGTVSPGDVAEAAAKYPDLGALWEKALYVSCGPNNAVCHQNKQFPHMEFATSLLDAIDVPCNQLRDDPKTITNLCEPEGDQLRIGTFTTRVGSVAATPEGAPTALTITLKDAIPPGTDTSSAAIVRKPQGLSETTIALKTAPFYGDQSLVIAAADRLVTLDYALAANKEISPGPSHLGTMADFVLARDYVLVGDQFQVELGDPNADGVFGHDLGGAIIKPGQPAKSYLLMRVMGPLDFGQNEITNMTAPPTKEPQMPIANTQYWDARHAIPALWCWIAGLKDDASNAEDPIDYEHCDIDAMPPIVQQTGEASTFSSLYDDVLLPHCSQCHSEKSGQPTTLYFQDPALTYSMLLGITGKGPSETTEMPYVTKNDPAKSFLFLKITGDPKAGARMPLGADPLDEATTAAIQKWIEQGANDN